VSGGRRRRYGRQALDVAVRLLDASVDGTRHHTRTKVGYLVGGYIAGGFLDEADALAALEPAVQRNTRDFHHAWQTLVACLEAGKSQALDLLQVERERQAWQAVRGQVSRPAPGGNTPSQRGVFARLRRW
jgi:hypothetical protein